MDATQPKWTAVVGTDGVRLTFPEPTTSVALSLEDLFQLRVAVEGTMLAACEPWADLTGAPSVEVGGREPC
jgi:hypothetical protein